MRNYIAYIICRAALTIATWFMTHSVAMTAYCTLVFAIATAWPLWFLWSDRKKNRSYNENTTNKE